MKKNCGFTTRYQGGVSAVEIAFLIPVEEGLGTLSSQSNGLLLPYYFPLIHKVQPLCMLFCQFDLGRTDRRMGTSSTPQLATMTLTNKNIQPSLLRRSTAPPIIPATPLGKQRRKNKMTAITTRKRKEANATPNVNTKAASVAHQYRHHLKMSTKPSSNLPVAITATKLRRRCRPRKQPLDIWLNRSSSVMRLVRNPLSLRTTHRTVWVVMAKEKH